MGEAGRQGFQNFLFAQFCYFFSRCGYQFLPVEDFLRASHEKGRGMERRHSGSWGHLSVGKVSAQDMRTCVKSQTQKPTHACGIHTREGGRRLLELIAQQHGLKDTVLRLERPFCILPPPPPPLPPSPSSSTTSTSLKLFLRIWLLLNYGYQNVKIV